MVRLARVVIVCAGLGVIPAAVYAQASITGVVRDASGAVIPGVTVEAASPALIEKVRSVVTDGGGQYPARHAAARQLHRHIRAVGIQHAAPRGGRADRHLYGHQSTPNSASGRWRRR